VIEFHLDQSCGSPPYHQLIRQVRQALRLGRLREGDRLPTVKDLAGRLGINQNTVLKAYRELEYDGLVTAQPGVGTFIRVSVPASWLAALGPLREELERWLSSARQAGLDDESIEALIATTIRARDRDVPPIRAVPSAPTVPLVGAR
jgi:GntR family transcriptional regulator